MLYVSSFNFLSLSFDIFCVKQERRVRAEEKKRNANEVITKVIDARDNKHVTKQNTQTTWQCMYHTCGNAGSLLAEEYRINNKSD